jgi:predicted neutral ceramidase superfamily lipid hydrolase
MIALPIKLQNIFNIPDFRKLYSARFFALAILWQALNSGLKNASSMLDIIMVATVIGIFFMGVFTNNYSKKKNMMATPLSVVILFLPKIKGAYHE